MLVFMQVRSSGHPDCLPFTRAMGKAVGGRMLTHQVSTFWDTINTDYIHHFSLMIHALEKALDTASSRTKSPDSEIKSII